MKKLIAIFSSIFLTSFLVTTLVSAAGPRFNYLEGDHKTLRGANFSAGDEAWHDPVDGKIGDTINWNIYIHNAVEGTTAHNTNVSVGLPQKPSSELEISAMIKASNADEINDTATLNLTSPGILEYISQSTELYNREGQKVSDLPDGITSGGIDIGDVQGCWPYAVFVVFKTEIKGIEDRFLTLDKKVRNFTNAEGFSNSNTASVGDILEYQLTIQNPGARTYEFILKDTLPSEFEYQANTLLLNIDGAIEDGADFSAFFNGDGVSLYLDSGSLMKINLKASVSSRALIGSSFRNIAILYGDETLSASVTTTVVPRGSVLGAAALPVTGSPITLSFAMAFFGTAIYYLIREEKLFRSVLIAVRTI